MSEPEITHCFVCGEGYPSGHPEAADIRAYEAEVERSLREMRDWADAYEDNMGPDDFKRRDEAFARADALLNVMTDR